ncbi:hypothetical protein [Streptomyces sp. NPDC003943]
MPKVVSYAGAVLVPAGAGVLLYLWASWSMLRSTSVPVAVALVVGVLLAGVALALHNALFREGGSIVAVLLLVAGLGSVWVEARDSRVRGATVECVVVGKPKAVFHETFGEDAPPSYWLYHHTLDCQGGYPSDFTARERIAEPGAPVRIAYDPEHRMDPVLAKDNVSTGSPVVPSVLLTLCAALTAATIAREGRPGAGLSRSAA